MSDVLSKEATYTLWGLDFEPELGCECAVHGDPTYAAFHNGPGAFVMICGNCSRTQVICAALHRHLHTGTKPMQCATTEEVYCGFVGFVSDWQFVPIGAA